MARSIKPLLLGLAGACLFALPACDAVNFPGFSKSPSERAEERAKVTDPVDTSVPPADTTDPVTQDPEPPATQPDTDTDNDTDTTPVEPDTSEETEAPAPSQEDIVEPPPEPTFSFMSPGDLIPGSGTGSADEQVYSPDMLFPVETAPAFLQSMVWNLGGGVKGGDQCAVSNYAYPWRDNFCEKRTSDFNTPTCPQSRVHLGQDIRVGTPADCETLRRTDAADRKLHRVIAVEDGVISSIGRYTVTLRSGPRMYRYMHLNMGALDVEAGDLVAAGDPIGYVSNDFGGTPTTFHLHFEIRQNLPGTAWAFVPPYRSLVAAYARREGGPGEEVEPPVLPASADVLIPPTDFIITE